ncbi:hypothetical protein SAMN05444001_10544 [Parabacteroides chinchillae]|uniref:Uncharacterized protein n=1 Tax=Parabacteroides chinchillae TaxID=871327 RepID=A0A8G2F3T7_9BACT|nr:hypothetical protein [Parabacteroides chinchillae]SEF70370.1 hypothetical protein SAMN05444001_10544 [Parabacteroides chinchillae]
MAGTSAEKNRYEIINTYKEGMVNNDPRQHSRKHWIDYSRRPTNDLTQTDCLIETGGDKQLAVDLINKVRYRAFVTTSPTDKFAQFRKFNVPGDKKVTEELTLLVAL